ncbi:MAG: hypothetical protein EHM59_18130, partial [Betaproteobacteria bacterium]
MTYGNACEAAGQGISVLHEGECGSTGGGNGDTCGGLAGLACAADEYCNFPISAQCGAADQTGTCEASPQACDAIFDPVCGCDGQVYGNACAAQQAGVAARLVAAAAAEFEPLAQAPAHAGDRALNVRAAAAAHRDFSARADVEE